ncbi:hypothetical protein [Alloacidobacterium sp.]|uniref:hypothetical protein n=1 Tax=Alloacidobacterium sp. TaxID=2951999 RepID=UPI002D6B52A5|nr:hypothetical protein [Alloacidobacterium sp.]HYK38292.1 hypothetical protein [Alloacidobacterium sp.]
MPAKLGRYEQDLIRLFVSAYENFAWAASDIKRLDEEKDSAIEALVKRTDGLTMAIEHTLIEPFIGDRSDLAKFERQAIRRRIEDDKSLAVPNTGIKIFVPVGIFDGQKPANRDVIVESIYCWIVNHRLHLREGMHQYLCDVPGMPPVTLTVERNRFGLPRPYPGYVLVGRQQVTNDLHKVIKNALEKKLPKLVKEKADRHVLLLERDEFNFFPDLIFNEIERQRSNFLLLENVDEIWHVETIFYKQGGHVYFELRRGEQVLETMTFENGDLTGHSKEGMPYPI